MYAIIRAGGHQEKVTPGEQITIDRVKQEVGEEISFPALMISRDDGTVVSDPKQLKDSEAAVVGTVVKHLKGDKVDVFMYRQKTGYRRHTGHRQPLTLVEIAEIRIGGEIARAPEPAAEEPPPAAEEPTEAAPAKKKAPAKAKARAGSGKSAKPPARKAPAKKKG